MNNLNLTIELCAEDRARLDSILTALQAVGTPFSPPAPAQTVETAPETNDAPAPVTSVPETEQPAQDTQDVAETQHTTHGMVQDLVITLASWGHKSEAREIVQRYAPRVSAIPDADLDAVYVALDAVRRAHDLLSASSAHRWLNCPPSAVAAELYPRETSEFAAEGTLAHEVAEAVVRGIPPENNHEITQEMLDCAAGYNGYIQEQTNGEEYHLLLEQRVDFSDWVPGGFGTCDCILLQGDTLDVIDYKYGKGVPVSADLNPQLMLYGLGALNDYGLAVDVQTVRLHIYQPRINNVSTSEVSAKDLLKWADSVREVAAVAATGGGEYRAGDWCKFCPHAGECRELTQTCTRLVDGYNVEVPVLAPQEVAKILEQEPLISLWLRRVKSRALAMALDGKPAPGWKAVEGRQGNRKWKDELEALHILDAAGYDRAETTETHLLSPAGIDKLVGKKKAAELLAGQIERSPGSPILVPESDKRPVYDPAGDFEALD